VVHRDIVSSAGQLRPHYHESSAGKENRLDRGETEKTFACKARPYKGKDP